MRPPSILHPVVVVFCLSGALACKDRAASGPAPAGSSATRETPIERTVAFRPLPVRVGDRWKTERRSKLKVTVEFWSGGERFGESVKARAESYVQQVEVLGLVGGATGQVRVAYDEYHLEQREPNASAQTDESLRGKTFLVDARNGELVVTDAEGKPVPDETSNLVRPHFARLGRDDAVVQALGRKPFVVGKGYPLNAPAMAALVGTTQGDFKSGIVTVRQPLAQGGQEVVPLDWSGELQSKEDNGMITDWHLEGKTTVSRGQELGHTIRGVLDVSGQTRKDGDWVRMEGAGTVEDQLTITPLG